LARPLPTTRYNPSVAVATRFLGSFAGQSAQPLQAAFPRVLTHTLSRIWAFRKAHRGTPDRKFCPMCSPLRLCREQTA
jgi:hypothetical protein